MQCFFSLRSINSPSQIGHRSVSSQIGAFFSMRKIIPCYGASMTESSRIRMGPYVMNVVATSFGILNIEISKQPFMKTKNKNKNSIQFSKAMEKFLKGDAHAFDSVETDVIGTAFQKKVWKAARKIPYGETRTYAQIAKQIGHPKAVRAVGTALGKNPTCILVPCHRVVPKSGGIGQYAFGKKMKQWLLDHEAQGARSKDR
jgi:methylated-DNA-[protein]-cysteine S-methyltransferase